MNIKMIISYDGTRYNGWQKQGNTLNTIQGKIESTLSKMFKIDIEISGAGRTDAGVHARGQVANFHVDRDVFERFVERTGRDLLDGMEIFKKYLNDHLPDDIKILSVAMVNPRFHARLNAKGKHYAYYIDNSSVPRVFDRKYVNRIEGRIDLEKMRSAADYMIGTHDFKSFCTNKKMKKSTVRTVNKIEISSNNGLIRIDYYGDGVLYNMIRIMTGTLVDVSKGRINPDDVKNIIEAKDRTKASQLARAKGLFLEEVYY